jgi:hypothetical protein
MCTVPLLFSYFLNAAVFLCTVSSSTIFVKGNGCSWLSLRYCRCISKNECRKLLNISSHTAELLSETGTRISGALKLHWFSYIGWGTSLSQKKPAITASSSKSFIWIQTQLSISVLFQSPDPPSQPEAAASTMEKDDSGKNLLSLVSLHQTWVWVSKMSCFTCRRSRNPRIDQLTLTMKVLQHFKTLETTHQMIQYQIPE